MNSEVHFDMDIMNNSYLYTDTGLLRKNIRTILNTLPVGTKLIPVLKDDAYGLGAAQVAHTAAEFDEIDCVAVANAAEGLALRASGWTRDILVMSSALPFQLPAAVETGLTLACASVDFARALEECARSLALRARVHIKIDTGLHRIGVEPGGELAALIAALDAAESIDVEGVFSHFADTDDAALTARQFARFKSAAAQLESAGYTGLMRHISCSAAHEQYPQYALDAVRIGRALYMDAPQGARHGIAEVATWRSYVTAVKRRRAGDTLGYSGAYTLTRDADVATIGVGYGDGLQDALCAAHAPVLIGGRECALLACCMDQAFADVTGVECRVGDSVTIFGYDEGGRLLSSQAQALLLALTGCGRTAALSPRVARIYG